jgi:predicted DNA-binding ribbon-helix-helix protein
MTSSLVSRNVVVADHRTSVRLEPELWDALADIARRERLSLNELCTRIGARRLARLARALALKAQRAKPAGRVRRPSLTSAIRVHILLYYRRRARA